MENEENKPKERINELVDHFYEAYSEFFSKMDKVSEAWDDKVSESFQKEVVKHTRVVLLDYLLSVNNVYHKLNAAVEEAKKLESWKAGLGGWMSLFDLKMVLNRGLSRLVFKRDDYRF